MGKMSSGMRMMAMAKAGQQSNSSGRHMNGNYSRMGDNTEMRRRRDSRGRYMEDYGDDRMEYDGGAYSRMDDEHEMKSRRNSSGRYMEGGTYTNYRPWPEPHIPPYLNEPDMRDVRNVRPGRERRSYAQDERVPVHMRDKNIVNIRDYQDRRKIGFGENRMHHDSSHKNDDEDLGEMMKGDSHHMGAYPMMEQLTQEIATQWVDGMKNSDPEHPTGAKWSKETTKTLAIKHGFNSPESQLEFWAVMNMMYSDYAETAKKHNVSTMDFYADMAKAWMRDKDGVKHKTAAYIACCTE